MKYHCNDCGCEFYFYASRTTDEPICPQCKGNNIRAKEQNTDATVG